MRLRDVIIPLVGVMLSGATVPVAIRATAAHAQAPRIAPGKPPSDAEIREAITAIERADGYTSILQTIQRYEGVLGSPRLVELADALLESSALDANQRGLVLLERQLSLDCRRYGPAGAARLLSIRFLAVNALAANTPQQFASVLEKFAPLAKEINPQLVRDALNTPGSNWPPPLLRLMEQLASDWPARGALEAATRMAAAGSAATAPPVTPPPPAPATAGRQTLPGHWRNTRIVFERANDEHLVLHPDGTAETWTVTASGREGTTRGRWKSQGTTLHVAWADGSQWSQAFTFFEGQLVFPNIPNQRKLWEAID